MLTIVEVKGVSKYYKVYKNPRDKLIEILLKRNKAFIKKALDGVSFEVYKGEAFGIIGENGAGKSTLLSIIAGVITPSSGEVSIRGRVASILELGAGFHPELTGIDNIFLYGNLMGMSESEIKRKLNFIKTFSELGEYIDKPIRTYSTGMIMRLAFSTILALEPDIFIIDEALSVGDLYFQKKVFNKIRDFKNRGGTLLFTSHSMYQITNLCERALWLKEGKVVMIGKALDVAREYENYIRKKDNNLEEVSKEENNKSIKKGNTPAYIERVEVNKKKLYPEEDLIVRVYLKSESKGKVHLATLFRRNDNENIALYSTKHENIEVDLNGKIVVSFVFEKLPLLYGDYYIDVYLTDEFGNVFYDVKTTSISIMKSSFLDIGIFRIKGKIFIGKEIK